MEQHAQDSPTHRLHVLQVSINDFQKWITELQARRNAVVEKVAKAKLSTKLTRQLAVHKQLARIMKKIERELRLTEEGIASATDELNKARALFFELSDGEVILEHTEVKRGSSESETDRGNTAANAQGPA